MSYHHLTINEREMVLDLKARGSSIRGIAIRMKRSASTISRELKRCSDDYSPHEAQQQYQRRRRAHRKPRLEREKTLRILIIRLFLRFHWSPEQIAARLAKEQIARISYATIYRYIYQHNLDLPRTSNGSAGVKRHLRHRAKRRYPKGVRRHREAQVDYLSIHERPKFIDQRQRIGDWEIDTVLGKTGHTVLVTAVERKTRLTLINKASKKTGQDINQALLEMFSVIPKEFVQSITPDHGREFLQLDAIKEQLGVTIYWPDPYSPEQRGTNENTNGLIREYFPKHQSLDHQSESKIKQCQDQLNHRPKKVLNFQTPFEVFFDKVLHLV